MAEPHEHHGTFGPDAFGRGAEHAARFFGTPQYIVGQTFVVLVWIALNGIAIGYHWDPYPFILLNVRRDVRTQSASAPLSKRLQSSQKRSSRLSARASEPRDKAAALRGAQCEEKTQVRHSLPPGSF